jgi:HAD superfamily phosphatase (TIGR01668 family)
MNQYFIKNANTKFRPNYFASSVLAIDYKQLYRDGIKCLAFDVDGTITKSASLYINIDLARQLTKLLNESKIESFILASNSIRDMHDILKELPDFKTVQPHTHKPKPTKSFYSEVIKKAGCRPEQIAMVGDRYIQDIWGAKKLGLKTILVALQPEYASNIDKLILRNIWQQKSVQLWALLTIKNKN